jgi:membrane protein implicated in regulation of membrane protease activity
MLDDFIDTLISKLMAGAGLIMAAAIAAVTGAMAIYAFLAPHLGAAWAYVVVAASATVTVAIWSLVQRQGRAKRKRPPLEQRIVDLIQAHPSGSFVAGLAAGVLFKGKPWQALEFLRAMPKGAMPKGAMPKGAMPKGKAIR